jgi:phage terminase large subunit-like protein
MNPILEYFKKIESEEIIACAKIKQVYKYIVDILNDEKGQWYYDADAADYAIDFIECFCKHSKGKFAGKPVLLELWEKALVAIIFGVKNKETHERRFREVFFVVGKKNGKSLLASAISNYMLVADGEGGAEVYSVGTKRDQAKIIWNESKAMVMQSPALRRRVSCLVNALRVDKTNSVFKPLSSDSDTEDGLNVSMASCDEVHAWKGLRGIELYNIVYNGISSRDEPLILTTTTGGMERDGIFDVKYDLAERVLNGYSDVNGFKKDSFLPVIYELDSRDEWLEEKNWIKANPNLGVSKKISYLRERVELAKEIPLNKKDVLCKEFNIRETSTDVFMSFEDINNNETFDINELRPKYCIGGTDLSRTTDLTSACILFRVPDLNTLFYKHMYWLPEDLLERKVKDDEIPYDFWLSQGFLRLSRGNKVDYDDVVKWFEEIQSENKCYLYDHGYDAWSSTAFIKAMNDSFGVETNHAVIQGKKTLSNPMYQLKAELTSKKVNYGNNPLTKWCITNVRADIDKNGNIQPAKSSNQRRRIDGFAAMLNAYVRYTEISDEYLRMIK